MPDDDIQITYYGYEQPGDKYYDPGSAAGLGDRQNALIAGYSAALTDPERVRRFGVPPGSKSTGREFEYGGKTYRDDDSPSRKLTDYRIDIYSPEGPGAVESGKRAALTFSKSKNLFAPEQVFSGGESPQYFDPSSGSPYSDPLPGSPEPEGQKPQPKREVPVDTIRRNYPELSSISNDQLIPKMADLFPDVPFDKLKVYAVQPGGAKMIREYQDRNLNPLERFRKHYPDLATGDDEKDIKALHDRFQPDMGDDQFKSWANPPGPVLSFLGHAYDQMTSGTVGAIEGLAKPQAAIGALSPKNLNALGAGALAGLEENYAKWEQFPKAYADAMAGLGGVWGQNASDWLSANVPGYAGTRDWFRNFVGALSDRGKQWEDQARKRVAAIPPGPGNQVAETAGEVLGSTPDMLVSFGLGSTGRAAALWGMAYEGISGYGHAVENHQKNALLQGVSDAGFRQFAQYLLNTGKGRIVSGIANSFASVADEEINKWARGEPNDITKDGKSAAVGFLIPLLFWGKHDPREAEPPAGDALRGAPSEEQTKTSPVQLELFQARDAHENGDDETASQYIDRALSLMPDSDKRELGKAFINKVDDLAADPKKQTLSPQDKLFNDYYFSGPPAPRRGPERRRQLEEQLGIKPGESVPSGSEGAPPEVLRLGKEAVDRFLRLPPEDKEQYLKHLDNVNRSYESTRGTEFHAGLPLSNIGRSIKEWFDNDRPGILPWFPRQLTPEYISERSQIAGQIVKKEEARSRAAAEVGPGTIYRRAQRTTPRTLPPLDLFEKITGWRFGRPIDRLDRFFHNFSGQELTQQFIDYQDKGPSGIKDPNARWIWENVIGPSYDAMEKREHAYRMEYGHEDNYFLQLLTHPKDDLPRLRNSLAAQGVSMTFTKPREMRLVERLALGHEMITKNPIRLMQIRWWMGERAIQKIRDAKQLEAQGLAWNSKEKGANIPADRKKWVDPDNLFTTPDKESYYVDPDIIPVLKNKFDSGDIFRTAPGPIFKFVAALKGTVAGKVSWSLFHPLHIMDIMQADVATDAIERVMAGKANWSDAFNIALNAVPFAGSIPAGTRAILKYRDPVNYLQGKLDFTDLSPDQQRDVSDFLDMGLVAGVSEERQMQFTRWLQENGPDWIRKGGPLVKMGLDVWGNPLGFNRTWFGMVTPRLKFASAMMRRDTLLKTRPDLFDPKNRPELLREYQKIHRDIEGRFGEMHYDNLLWPRMLKQTGTTFMLALGWQLGLFRTMGDGVVDLTKNAAHMREILDGWKNQDPAARKLVTNRMIFSAMYVARGLAAGAAITYFIGHKKQPDLWDGVYPLVGKDANGRDKRVNMQYFYKDAPAFAEYARMKGSTAGALMAMGSGKINPMTMAIIQAANNRDFMDHVIGGFPERIMHVLRQGLDPISFENMMVPGQTPGDQLMSMLGFSPSGRWTMRSDMENKIIADALETREYGPLLDARDRYRQAWIAKDQPAIKAAHDELIKLKVTEKQIRNIEKTANIPVAQKMFKTLTPEQQRVRWNEMTPEERKQYRHLLKPGVLEPQ